jgi:hypothetical protein
LPLLSANATDLVRDSNLNADKAVTSSTQLLGKPNRPLSRITITQDSLSNEILNGDGNNTVRLYQKFIAFCNRDIAVHVRRPVPQF